MSKESIKKALDFMRDNSGCVYVEKDWKALFISDLHLGVRDEADDFKAAGHEVELQEMVLNFRSAGFKICGGGDIFDCWENGNYMPIKYNWVMDMFDYKIEGNHDQSSFVPSCIKFMEPESGKYILWTHGHKGDWPCDTGSFLSRVFVRYIWAGIGQRFLGLDDPTSAQYQKSPSKHFDVMDAFDEWALEQDDNLLAVIYGHLHWSYSRPRVFNSGSMINKKRMEGVVVTWPEIKLLT